MLYSPSKLTYCGLTIILSNPSRFDSTRLLSASGGELLGSACLRPEFNLMQCDVRLMEEKTPLLEGTRCLLLLGESAMHHFCLSTRNNSLNEMRGTLLDYNGIPTIASYFPQDASDFKNYEKELNEHSKEYNPDDEMDRDDEDGDEDAKTHGKTKRSNYFFWLKRDVWKVKQILISGKSKVDLQRPIPNYRIYPPADEIINILSKTKEKYLDFDMETDREDQNMQCFSFSLDDARTVYSVPCLDYNYRPAYSALPFIYRALAIAIRDNTIVAHNGAAFDFFILAHKMQIPIYKCYDTMLAQHRIFPDVEKSLGHVTSYWTWEPFHKDTDSGSYCNQEQMMQRLHYCAKDVFTMSLARQEMQKYIPTIPGLQDSVDCAMASIRPYLIMILQGIRYDDKEVDKIKTENDRLLNQYLRIIYLLIGKYGMEECKKVTKNAKALPTSNKQCCNYFHELLGYPVVQRSGKTQLPSLAKKAMFRLALKHNNPVISVIMAYRQVLEEYKKLKFYPWKDDNGVVVPFVNADKAKAFNPNQSMFKMMSSI